LRLRREWTSSFITEQEVEMPADIVIRGGTVLDGSGEPGRTADVAIEGGVIREIGPKLAGKRTLDASGCVVAPGFIDVHTHYDAQVFWDPALQPSPPWWRATAASRSRRRVPSTTR
jgi:N-acyl-D-aspartate/D-glutamate deacylase